MAAPKGNEYWKLAQDLGANKKWATPDDLQKDIDLYFAQCDSNTEIIVTKDGIEKIVKKKVPYTVEGLCEVLDCDRNTLLNYQKQEGYEAFFRTIKKAKNKIARNKVERGMTGDYNAAVTIFDLKNNHGYVDKKEIDANVKQTGIDLGDETPFGL